MGKSLGQLLPLIDIMGKIVKVSGMKGLLINYEDPEKNVNRVKDVF